jgi:hypothetical protein
VKTLNTVLILVALSLCARCGNAQQCGTPSATLTDAKDVAVACPLSSSNPYDIEPISSYRTYTFQCTADSNVLPPPNPGTTYHLYSGSNEWGYGATYCNRSSPYSSYQCPPIMHVDVTRATSPTDYNRFYNQAFSYTAANGSCPQTNFVQDFDQCNGLACSPPPPPPGGGGGSICDACGNPDQVCPRTCGGSPIIIDVTDQGFSLTNAANGVKFDISDTGNPIQMAWTAPGAANAFLCLPDATGRCDDGKDLFGNFTPQPPSGSPNGFAALAVYDQPSNGGNGDGIIDSRDAIFSSLRLWVDANHDGISQPNELFTLPSLGVNSISLTYKWSGRTDQYGNVFRYRAQVNPGDTTNTGRVAYDVFFVLLRGSQAILSADAAKCAVPTKGIPKGGLLSTGSR